MATPSYDPTAARELELYIENDGELYRQRTSYVDNMKRKMRNGSYDPAKGTKLWLYWVEKGAQKYQREFGSGGTDRNRFIFDLPTRWHVAKRVEEHERQILAEQGVTNDRVGGVERAAKRRASRATAGARRR